MQQGQPINVVANQLAEILLDLRLHLSFQNQPAGANIAIAVAEPCDRLILTLELPPLDVFTSPAGRAEFLMALEVAAREIWCIFPQGTHLVYETDLVQRDPWHHTVRIIYTDMTLEYEERRQRCRAVTMAMLLAVPWERGLRAWFAQSVWQTRMIEEWQLTQRNKPSVRRCTINL